jgi:hypothetical protein
MLITALILVAIVVAGIIINLVFDVWDSEFLWGLGCSLWLLGGICLAVLLIVWPMQYHDYKEKIAIYQATKQTIDEARKNNVSEVERAALTTKIIEVNEILAAAKYENEHTIFKDSIPDDFANLPYLK